MYTQKLERYKHDIAERHCGFRTYTGTLLIREQDSDYRKLIWSNTIETNPVRGMRDIIEYNLQSEERAEGFLMMIRKTNQMLYQALETFGEKGKFGEYNQIAQRHQSRTCA